MARLPSDRADGRRRLIVMELAPRTKLVLVRHGQTDANAAGRFQGQQDVPLNKAGRRQAHALAERLARMSVARVVSSDLDRAMTTAEAVAKACGVGVACDRRLREIDVGSWQGRSGAEVAAENPWFEDALRWVTTSAAPRPARRPRRPARASPAS